MYMCSECDSGYTYDVHQGKCKQGATTANRKTLYVNCPVVANAAATTATGTAATSSTAAVANTNANGLAGCAVCAHHEGEPASNMWCEKCRPGYFQFNGGCFTANDGTSTPNDEICRNCLDCRRFSKANDDHIEYRCVSCKPGFFQAIAGHTKDCNAPAENHCSKDSAG